MCDGHNPASHVLPARQGVENRPKKINCPVASPVRLDVYRLPTSGRPEAALPIRHSLRHSAARSGRMRQASMVLGNRLTVDPQTLTLLVLVRIQVPQPNLSQVIDIIEIIGLKIRVLSRFDQLVPKTGPRNWCPTAPSGSRILGYGSSTRRSKSPAPRKHLVLAPSPSSHPFSIRP